MPAYKYYDCTITIADLEKITIQYIDEGEKTKLPGKLSSDQFAFLTVDRLNYWVNYALRTQETRPTEKLYDISDLKVIGLNLYSILFFDENIRNGFRKAYRDFDTDYRKAKNQNPKEDPPLRMRLKLVFMKPAESLGRLPWEFLFVPGEDNDIDTGFFFSGQKTELILTRFVPAIDEIYEPQQEELKILLAVSRAKVGGVGIDEKETDALIQQIKGIPHAKLTVLTDPTYDQLMESIETSVRPHILHYIGHGKPGGLAIFKAPTEDDYDIDEGGAQVRWLTSEQFRYLFNNFKPRLVFLHGCKGAAADSLEGFSSTARELVYAEIPAVVAMQYNISNMDAGKFARTFYEELGKGSEIDEAVKAGRIELGKSFPPWEHPRFGTPVVYLQTEKAIVLSMEEEIEVQPEVEVVGQVGTISPGTPLPLGETVKKPTAGERTTAAPTASGSDKDRTGFVR
jgi:hypothetical protein